MGVEGWDVFEKAKRGMGKGIQKQKQTMVLQVGPRGGRGEVRERLA